MRMGKYKVRADEFERLHKIMIKNKEIALNGEGGYNVLDSVIHVIPCYPSLRDNTFTPCKDYMLYLLYFFFYLCIFIIVRWVCFL